MSARTMDYATAMAAGWDAANRSMRAAGRSTWNEEDWIAACALVDRLLGPNWHLEPRTSP